MGSTGSEIDGELGPPRRAVFQGEIESVGKNVSRFGSGDQVFGATRLRFGAYAEYLCLPASHTIVSKPDNITFIEAAAVPLGGLNAMHFMRKANIRNGEKVLVNGAGGSIGTFAVQIAKAMGAELSTPAGAVNCQAACRCCRRCCCRLRSPPPPPAAGLARGRRWAGSTGTDSGAGCPTQRADSVYAPRRCEP